MNKNQHVHVLNSKSIQRMTWVRSTFEKWFPISLPIIELKSKNLKLRKLLPYIKSDFIEFDQKTIIISSIVNNIIQLLETSFRQVCLSSSFWIYWIFISVLNFVLNSADWYSHQAIQFNYIKPCTLNEQQRIFNEKQRYGVIF